MLSPSETVEFSRVSGTGSGSEFTLSAVGAVPPAGKRAGRMAGRAYARRHARRHTTTESRAPTRMSCCSRVAAAGVGGSASAPELASAPR
eukprot:scaffold122623_cov60-Phaeocystis_antarctica.AAC.2